MERFVQLIVAGGLALLGGLWIVAIADGIGPHSAALPVGVALTVVGTAGVFVGIWRELSL